MPCERCVNRREFLAAAAGVAGLVVITGCGDGQISGVSNVGGGGGGGSGGGGSGGGGGSQQVVIIVSNFPGLATTGTLVEVTTMAPSYAVKRTGASSFDAFSMICTHQGCTVEVVNGQRFDCPCHGSRFANDGSVINGPASRPLDKVPTSYDSATDMLTIG
jgi:Rieske Fe-S protein